MSAAVAQPANDHFADRTVISEGAAGVWGSLSNATSELGEPRSPEFQRANRVGELDGAVDWRPHLSVTCMGFSPLLTAYTGNDLSGLSLIASNNYGGDTKA